MKKGLALLLAVSMIVGLLPTFALAADLGFKADNTYIVLDKHYEYDCGHKRRADKRRGENENCTSRGRQL